MKLIILMLSIVFILSCNSADDYDVNCTNVFVYGLSVSVVDANNGALIIENTIVRATEGEYSEELMLQDDVFVGAGERPGTYTLSVEANGYAERTVQNILVDATFCHVITENVEVRLFPN